MQHASWLAAMVLLAACDPQEPGGGLENRGPIPTVEGSDKGKGSPVAPTMPGAAPRAGNESVTGANVNQGGGGIEAFPVLVDPYGQPRVPAQQLVAHVVGTAAHPGVRGEVRFSVTGSDLHVKSNVTGLPEGAHAHHVHLFGDCTAPETTAGPHFDFERGSASPAGGITGDLGDLMATATGPATAERSLVGLNFGPLLGRSVVIHAGANDPAKAPEGGAGEAIACGVIGVVGSAGAPGPTPGTGTPVGDVQNPGQIRNAPVPGPQPPPAAPPPGGQLR